MLSRIRDHLSYLGLCDFICKDPAHSFSLGMNLQHNPSCLGAVHRKETLQDIDNEFHGGVVVIDEDDLVEWRALEFWRRFLDDQSGAFPTSFYVTHESLVYRVRNRGLQDVQPKAGHKRECRQSVSFYFNKQKQMLERPSA